MHCVSKKNATSSLDCYIQFTALFGPPIEIYDFSFMSKRPITKRMYHFLVLPISNESYFSYYNTL